MIKKLIRWLNLNLTKTRGLHNKAMVKWLGQSILTTDDIEELVDDLEKNPTIVLQFVIDMLPELLPMYGVYSEKVVIVSDVRSLAEQVVQYLKDELVKPTRKTGLTDDFKLI